MNKARAIQAWVLAAVVVVAALSGVACNLKTRSYPTQPAARNFENPETSIVAAAFLAALSPDPEDFTAIFTDLSTGNIEKWSWDFGDGTMSTAQSPVHTYKTFGTYVVTLTVTNSISSDSATQFVTFDDPNAAPPTSPD